MDAQAGEAISFVAHNGGVARVERARHDHFALYASRKHLPLAVRALLDLFVGRFAMTTWA